MNIEKYRTYCLAKPGVTEEFPFDEVTLVFKVMGKMFALTNVDLFDSVNLKVDPEESVLLQERFDAVTPGYHMNKKHWITVEMDGSVPEKELLQWTDNSYKLVVSKLTKKEKVTLERG